MKLANKPEGSGTEPVERRQQAEGNTSEPHTCRTQSRESVSPGLERVRERARHKKKEQFTALLHHIDVGRLKAAYLALRRKAAAGVDGITWQQYGEALEANLADLHERVHRGTYRALPSRRTYVDKSDGSKRPLAVAALEDKVLQRAVVEVLNAIYEADFLGFSYGFRPGRSQHDALDALATAIVRTKVNWIVDADIAGFFDGLSRPWLERFLRHRIGDARVLRLISKWLTAGVLEHGELKLSEHGTPQGAVVSPLLANVYLHYCFDLWAQRWRRRHACGKVIFVRYADDIVAGFEHEWEAKRFLADMRERLGQFALSLHPHKTRLIEFGRFAAGNRARRGLGKPETFKFLGFIHICDRTPGGAFRLRRKTRPDRMRERLRKIKGALRAQWHRPIAEQGKWLQQVVRGYFAYHAVPTNSRSLNAFRRAVMFLWLRALRRRSQRDRTSVARVARLAERWLPAALILHPVPFDRFLVKHPRWEPGA